MLIDGRHIPVKAGEEYLIPRGVAHSGEVMAGTRTIHVFRGHLVNRETNVLNSLKRMPEIVSMKIAARVSNTPSGHTVEVETDGRKQPIAIAPKPAGCGSSVNGGELLFTALATCFCNDLYREATKRSIEVRGVEVEVNGIFGNPGEPARDISYRAQVHADAPQTAIDNLIRATDFVTEIQCTLRGECPVRWEQV